jgi:hypothetical protein
VAVVAVLALAILQPVPGKASRVETPSPPKAEGSEWNQVDETWTAKALSVEPTSADFTNRTDSPVRIRYAEVRNVPGVGRGAMGVTMPELVIENRDPSRRVAAVLVGLDLPTTRDRVWLDLAIAPAETSRLQMPSRHWSAVVPASDARHLSIHIDGVRFDDGQSWVVASDLRADAAAQVAPKAPSGKSEKVSKERTPRAPDPTVAAPKPAPNAKRIPALIRNPQGAPVVVVEALTPVHDPPKSGEPRMTWLPDVKLENRSAKTVVAVRLRYKPDHESHAVTGQQVRIEAHGSATVHRDLETWGRPEDMKVQLLGVRFSDGTVWGTLDSTIDARDTWVYPLDKEGR